MKGLNDGTKMQLMAFGPLVAVIFLTYIVWTFGYSKVSDIRRNIKKAQNDQTNLNQKLGTLRNVPDNVILGAQNATIAFPESNPSVVLLSQIRSLSQANSVTIGNIKSGSEVSDSSGLQRVDVTFDITGGRGEVIQTILDIQNLAPITVLDKVKLNETGGVARSTVSVKSFWAVLPTQLPALTEKVADLTTSETNLLEFLNGLRMPDFSTITAGEGAGKSDPFSP